MSEHVILSPNPLSNLLLLIGLFISIFYWARSSQLDLDMLPVLMGVLCGGFLGAKLGFVVAEGWLWWNSPAWLLQLLYGKTILGGLLGGWAGVELGKYLGGQQQTFGDQFARVIPIGISIGRLSCLVHGCCRGRPSAEIGGWLGDAMVSLGWSHWPVPIAEIFFQLGFLLTSFSLRRVTWLKGQHFHLYVISYGLFRFAHEFLRDTPRLWSWVSPYMILALLCAAIGSLAFITRHRSRTKNLGKSRDLEAYASNSV